MADGFGVDLERLIDDLRQMPEQLKGEAANHITAAANRTETALRQRYAPADGGTGALLRGIRQKREGRLKVRVQSTAPHAHWFEFGTGRRVQWSTGKYVGQMPAQAQPVFIPESQRARGEMYRQFERMLKTLRVRNMSGSAG